MSKLSLRVEDKAHAVACKKVLVATYPKLQWKNGYAIYKWIQENFDKLDWKVIRFWVVKKDYGGYKRGQKIMKYPEMKSFVKSGGKVRNIFTFPKTTRKAMRPLMRWLDVPIQGQKGFTKDENIFSVSNDIATSIDNVESIVAMDLQDAFDQITQDQVKAIFKYVFDLNRKDTERMAEAMCYEGHLFQGNPIAPLLFNIWSSRLVYVMARCNVEVLQYADDLTIKSGYEYVSAHWLSFLHDLTTQLGFKVNPQKTERQRKRHQFQLLGLRMIVYEAYGGYAIYPQKLRKVRRNLRLWQHLEDKGITRTRRLNAKGEPIRVSEMKKGLENWLNQCQVQSSRAGLLAYVI